MQAVFIVWVQKTRAYIANDVVLYINYISMLSFAPAISFAAEPQVCCSWRLQMLCLLHASCLTAPLHFCANLCACRTGDPSFVSMCWSGPIWCIYPLGYELHALRRLQCILATSLQA